MGLFDKIKMGIDFAMNPEGTAEYLLDERAVQTYMKEYRSLSKKAIEKEYKRQKGKSSRESYLRCAALERVHAEN